MINIKVFMYFLNKNLNILLVLLTSQNDKLIQKNFLHTCTVSLVTLP